MEAIDVDLARDRLEGIIERGEKVLITFGGRGAVLMSKREYDSIMETLHLLSDPEMAADLEHSRTAPLSEMEVWRTPDAERSACDH